MTHELQTFVPVPSAASSHLIEHSRQPHSGAASGTKRLILGICRTNTTMMQRVTDQFQDVQSVYQPAKSGLRKRGKPDYSIYGLRNEQVFVIKETIGRGTGAEVTFDVLPDISLAEQLRPLLLRRNPAQCYQAWVNEGWDDIELFELAYQNLERHAYMMTAACPDSLLVIDVRELLGTPWESVQRICEHFQFEFDSSILNMTEPLVYLDSLPGTADFRESNEHGHFKVALASTEIQPQREMEITLPQEIIARLEHGPAMQSYQAIGRLAQATRTAEVDGKVHTIRLSSCRKRPPVKPLVRANFESNPNIVCTLGPASYDVQTLVKMIEKGMGVARFNYSHGDFSFMHELNSNLSLAEAITGQKVIRLADLPGPKIRLGRFENPMVVDVDDCIALHCGVATATELPVSTDGRAGCNLPVEWAGLARDLEVGHTVFINDGKVKLSVIKIEENVVLCSVLVGGEISNRKGLNLPDTKVSLPALGANDLTLLDHAVKEGNFDYVAVSFVRDVSDIELTKTRLRDHGSPLQIIAKIEHPLALENLDSIIDASNAVMIARGDLAVEIRLEETPFEQQRIIVACKAKQTPVIVATQMMESMTSESAPTRAETGDVWLAVQQGADGVMLSGETATGHDPALVVATMRRIANEAASRKVI